MLALERIVVGVGWALGPVSRLFKGLLRGQTVGGLIE